MDDGIDWRRWGLAHLREAAEDTVPGYYLSADCPRCGRHRLEPPEPRCEKCNWAPPGAEVRKDRSTPDNARFWDDCAKAAETVKRWPTWKSGDGGEEQGSL